MHLPCSFTSTAYDMRVAPLRWQGTNGNVSFPPLRCPYAAIVFLPRSLGSSRRAFCGRPELAVAVARKARTRRNTHDACAGTSGFRACAPRRLQNAKQTADVHETAEVAQPRSPFL
eukprot:621735-Alexandrium_andersonii.AAC.1